MTTVRPASPHDSERLRHVHAESWRAGYRGLVPDAALRAVVERRDAEWYRKMVEDPGTPRAGSWVVEESGEVVGFAAFRDATDDDLGESHGEIPLFYLLEEAWGTGAARMLLDHVLDDMRVVGFTFAVLWGFADNSRAGRFYEKAGFNLDGAEKIVTFGDADLLEVRYRLAL